MAKRLLVLMAVLAAMLAAAAPAFAQEEQVVEATEVEPPVTGVLKDTGLGDTTPGYEDPTYGLIDESSGIPIILESGVYDLSAYLGERVTADGTLTPDNPPGASFSVLDVTSLELAGPPETATVTFRLTIDGVVPEGRTFGLGYRPIGYLLQDFQGVAFCTTDTEDPDPAPQGGPTGLPDESTLPICEDGGTYTDTLEVPLGEPFSFDYLVDADRDDVQCDPGRMGPLEVFYSDTRTFTEDATVSATYVEDGLPPGCRAVGKDDSGSGDGSGSSESGAGGVAAKAEGVPKDVGAKAEEGKKTKAETKKSEKKELPKTGGATLPITGVAGALLVAGGLLARRLAR